MYDTVIYWSNDSKHFKGKPILQKLKIYQRDRKYVTPNFYLYILFIGKVSKQTQTLCACISINKLLYRRGLFHCLADFKWFESFIIVYFVYRRVDKIHITCCRIDSCFAGDRDQKIKQTRFVLFFKFIYFE